MSFGLTICDRIAADLRRGVARRSRRTDLEWGSMDGFSPLWQFARLSTWAIGLFKLSLLGVTISVSWLSHGKRIARDKFPRPGVDMRTFACPNRKWLNKWRGKVEGKVFGILHPDICCCFWKDPRCAEDYVDQTQQAGKLLHAWGRWWPRAEETNREAQYAFFNRSADVGSSLLELDRCDTSQEVYASLTVKDLTELTGIIPVTNGKVKPKERKGLVVLDMVNAQETRQQGYTDAQEGNRKSTGERHRQMWRPRKGKEELII